MDIAHISADDLRDRSLSESSRSARVETARMLPQTTVRKIGERIAIKAKSSILLIDPSEVVSVEAHGNYVVVQQVLKSHRLRESISTMEEKLAQHGFVRIHRSVIVNAAWVDEIRQSEGDYVLRVRAREYKVTRTYRKNLRMLAQSWIGKCSFMAD